MPNKHNADRRVISARIAYLLRAVDIARNDGVWLGVLRVPSSTSNIASRRGRLRRLAVRGPLAGGLSLPGLRPRKGWPHGGKRRGSCRRSSTV
jgi:hypothetical protein